MNGKKMKSLMYVLLFLAFVSCSEQDPSGQQAEKLPPKLVVDDILEVEGLKNLSVDIGQNGNKIATVSTNNSLKVGEAKFQQGWTNFDIHFDLENSRQENWTFSTEFVNLFKGNVLQKQTFPGVSFSGTIDPGVYIVTVIAENVNEEIMRKLKFSLISQCEDPDDFGVNLNAGMSVTAVAEKLFTPPGGPNVWQSHGVYNFSFNNNIVNNSSGNEEYVVFVDTNGDEIPDYGPTNVPGTFNRYSNYADDRPIHVNVVSSCGLQVSASTTFTGAFNNTVKEDWDHLTSRCTPNVVASTSLTWPLCNLNPPQIEDFFQGVIVKTDSKDDREAQLTGTLNYVKGSSGAYAVNANISGNVLTFTAIPSSAFDGSNTSNIKGSNQLSFNITNLQKNGSHYTEEQPNAKINKLTLTFTGYGDLYEPLELTTTNCSLELKLPTYSTTHQPCGSGYSGEGYTYQRYYVKGEVRCGDISNQLQGVDKRSVELVDSEFWALMPMSTRSGKCTNDNPSPPGPPAPPGPPGPVPTPPSPPPPPAPPGVD
jgi:hypothetical protein